jgi:Flp pilus assembly protein TadG
MMRRFTAGQFILLPWECNLRALNSEALRHARSERGLALVEFALSVTILFTLVFGVTAMSTALYTYHFVSEAAREGSRYVMVRGSSCATYGKFASDCPMSTTNTTLNPSPVQAYVRGLGYPGINPANMTVSTTFSKYPAGGACAPLATCNNPGDLVTVIATYTYVLSIPFVPTRTLTMSSSSKMIIAD